MMVYSMPVLFILDILNVLIVLLIHYHWQSNYSVLLKGCMMSSMGTFDQVRSDPLRSLANYGKKNESLVFQCFTSKQWKKNIKILYHFEALQKVCQMRPWWMSQLHPFRNGIRMKTDGQEFGISPSNFLGLSLF